MQSMTACSTTRSAIASPKRFKRVSNGCRVSMRKRGIHPQYFEEAKVYCKGEHVLTLGGTQEEYHVEIWSGNHPLFQGKEKVEPLDDGPLAKFAAKYPGLEEFMIIPTLTEEAPEAPPEPPKKPKKEKKKEVDLN